MIGLGHGNLMGASMSRSLERLLDDHFDVIGELEAKGYLLTTDNLVANLSRATYAIAHGLDHRRIMHGGNYNLLDKDGRRVQIRGALVTTGETGVIAGLEGPDTSPAPFDFLAVIEFTSK